MNYTDIRVGKKYRHFKGREYVVLAIAQHTEESETLVVYTRSDEKSLYTWARPIDVFAGKTGDGKERFVEVEE